MKCENCNNEHDGSYGSGRFCSYNCAKKFVLKLGFQKSHAPAPYGKWKCKWCLRVFRTQVELKKHCPLCDKKQIKRTKLAWNKGLTKDSDIRVANYGKANHLAYKTGKNICYMLGKHHSEENRYKISCAMKLAHKEGRAHNIGECRWNNEPSWPEKWFMQVIENEFEDKNYQREFPFHRFSLDFAWIHKKKCIEIDGEQHQKDPKQQERDQNKDKLLKEDGWKLLRLDWKWVCNNTKEAIKLARDFIE